MCSEQRKQRRRRLGRNTVGPATGEAQCGRTEERGAQKQDPSARWGGHATNLDCTLTTVGGSRGSAAREGHAQICTKEDPSGAMLNVDSCRGQ